MSKRITPPPLASRIFHWFSREAYTEDLIGDAEEVFYKELETQPVWKCRMNYWRNILSLIFSYTLKKRKADSSYAWTAVSTNPAMIKNYIKVAYRNLRKHALFTTINLVALSVGMSVSLLLIAVIADVRDYDRFHSNYDTIYRIVTKIEDPERPSWYASSPVSVHEFLEAYSDVALTAPLQADLSGDVLAEEDKFPIEGYFVSPDFFRVFDFRMKSGDAITSLENEESMLLTVSEAIRLFGNEQEALGKIVSIAPYGEFIVTGILEDHPKKSHLHFGMLASYQRFLGHRERSGGSHDFLNHYNYFLLQEGASVSGMQESLDKFAARVNEIQTGPDQEYKLEAISDVNFGREYRNSTGPQWDGLSMSIFGFLAFLILAPACVNYANLSIARSLTRAKEIGVRKVAGGQKKHIFYQFIVETTFMVGLAFLAAWGIFIFLRSEFLAILAPASRAGLSLEFSPTIALFFILFVLIVSVLIGLFPGLHFARIRPLEALKGKFSSRRRKSFSPANILLTIQFTLSLGFIMAVGIILDQYQYSMNYSLGFTKENIMNIPLEDVTPDKFTAAYDSVPYLETLSYSSGVIGIAPGIPTWIHTGLEDSLEAVIFHADQHFLSNHNIPLVAGRPFSENPVLASREVIVNEAFVRKLESGSVHDILNQDLKMDNDLPLRIAGVMKDVHFHSLREEIKPLIMTGNPEAMRYANLKVPAGNNPHIKEELRRIWENISEKPFASELLDDQIEAAYYWYFNMIKMVGFLGTLAISVSCLGLLGMVVFNVTRREKEVGIRKVHGATTAGIVFLLSRQYVIIFIIACLIGIPATTFLFNSLMPFIQHYSSSVGVVPALISVVILFIIAGATVSTQTIKAALTNPADTLRAE